MQLEPSLPPLPTTAHFLERSAQRHLAPAVLAFIMDYGVEHRRCGATHLTVIDRKLPEQVRDTPLAHRARGWIVLLTDEGVLLTCYRHRDASHFLRCKPKTKLTRWQLHQRARASRRARRAA